MAATHAQAFARSRPWSEDEFSGLLQNPACFATGEAACFALIRVVVDVAELLTIATHPDNRRQGLARACMARWQIEAHEKGAIRAILEVAADNLAAHALYRVCGFKICGSRRGYYQRDGANNVDALMMARRLT
jgi:[ribosomal protein S18]-alanine N-acetyltransferase